MGRKVGSKDLCDPMEMGAEKRRPQQVVCCRAESETGDWIWRRGGSGEDLQLACLLPWPELLVYLLLIEPVYFCGGVLSFCPTGVTMTALLQPSHIGADGFL